MKYLLKSIFVLSMLSPTIHVYSQTSVPLYRDVPNSKPAPSDYVETTGTNGWITKVTNPSLTAYFPEPGKANGAAVIVIPGGGYSGIANNHEGIDVAKKFVESGVTAFLLKYRLPDDRIMKDRAIGPIQDAQRAIQIIRERAVEWRLDTGRIGVIGFSAGGHLASTLGTHYDHSYIDNKRHVNLRPDFMILVYPVINMGEYTHMGSKTNLIGKEANDQQVDRFSNEKQVRKTTPPVFLIHAQDDGAVPVQNSLLFYEQILKNSVKAEMYLYQQGGHGFGMYNKAEKEQWMDRVLNWLDLNKFFAYK
jgi:acetyl esterase/lipase